MALQDSFVKKIFTPEEDALFKKQEEENAFLSAAGLEDKDINKLKKTLVRSDEAIAARKEQLINVRQRKGRKKDWHEYVDAKRRMGRVIHHSELLRKIRNMVPSIIANDGRIDNTISLYKYDGSMFSPTYGRVLYLGWIHYGWNPEYEIDICNDAGVPISQKRGWRTILLRWITRRATIEKVNIFGRAVITKIRAPIITEEQAYQHFGYPTNGATASNFREALYAWRNGSY